MEIGKAGIELLYNSKLKGENGCEIYIDDDGLNVQTILKKDRIDGKNIDLTIDVNLQEMIFNEFKDDSSGSVAINYSTGEILALVSTPSYDANRISLGVTDEEWSNIIKNKNNPMFVRFFSKYLAGSTIKPIVGAIGIDTESFSEDQDFGKSGRKWQKDNKWNDFYVTTLETYNGKANLENALVYSDNIYFAKAAIKIGRGKFIDGLNKFGFNSQMNFDINVDVSTYGNIDSEAKLAVSGFGQGDMEVNPIFMSRIYSAFANGGNAVMPYLIKGNNKSGKLDNLINPLTAGKIKNALKKVIDKGTGKNAKIEGKNLYGKTGTAEVKMTKVDNNGEEIGWFDVFNDNNLLIVNMVENVKNRRGSHYNVLKIREIFDKYDIIN